ncbi:MAG: transporter solute binding protein [Microbacteriaceae bacterium]|nr:transporter solute binding protein [Microbacteriaceae bacterium]
MRVKILPVMLACTLLLAGCSASPSHNDGLIHVVASTDVYGDIARQVGGSAVSVVSIIDDPSQDPHSFEADAQVQLSLSKADIVLENGGGYDSFVDTLLAGAGNKDVVTLNATTISGYATPDDFNEHLWYDFATVQKVVTRLVTAFSESQPSKAAEFTSNGAKFSESLAGLQATEAEIAETSRGAGVAITEPVPLYLLAASGLIDKTPPAFSEAIEQGTDVSPLVMRQTLALFSSHLVKVFAYNSQTTGPQTDQVLAAATAAGVGVVPMTETLPAGRHYISWMTANLAAVKAALA